MFFFLFQLHGCWSSRERHLYICHSSHFFDVYVKKIVSFLPTELKFDYLIHSLRLYLWLVYFHGKIKKKYRKLNGEFTFIERWKIKVKLKRFLFRTYAWCCGHSRKVCILYLQYILGFFHLRISTIIHTCIRAD